jgi:hypothetical protein
LCAIERQFLAIHGKKILAKKFTQVLEHVTEAPDNRIIAPDGLLRLADVLDIGNDSPEYDQPYDKNKQG